MKGQVSADPSKHDLPGKFMVWADPESKRIGVDYQCGFTEYFLYLKNRSREPLPLFLKHNSDAFDNYLHRDNEPGTSKNWLGGSHEDLISPHNDFEYYNRAIRQIEQAKLWKEVAFSFSNALTRRRTKSQHDGDFDFDKRWEIEPYTQRTKKNQSIRTVKLKVEAAFSSSVSNQEISNYGAFVTAIVTLLERNGVLVDLVVRYSGNGHTRSNKDSEEFQMEFKIKKADEYMPTSQILKCLSTVWWRRAVFALIAVCADEAKEEVHESLGKPKRFGKVWERKEDTLWIYSVPDFDKQREITKELLNVVGSIRGE